MSSDLGLGPSGTRLYGAIADGFELGDHELSLLLQAARTADLLEDLQASVDEQGALVDGRVHPAVVELRQQRICLARLLVALRVPDPEDEGASAGRLQRRGTRGVYGMGGGA
jgi:hypothetical protein